MSSLRILTAASTIYALILASVSAQEVAGTRFCIVPVQHGTPTKEDVGQAWRMVSRIVMLPDVPRPVIYPANRRGVWTIDERRSFVPFGGAFPSNGLLDKFVRDPETGRIIGINRFTGLFALDPGEAQFRLMHPAGGKPLSHPNSIDFIPRLNGFVVIDAGGFHLLDRKGELLSLPVSDRTLLQLPFSVFDLPAFNAVLINTQGPLRSSAMHAVVRFDDGEIVRVASLDRNDYVLGVNVAADGTLSLRGNRRTYTVRLSRLPVNPTAQAASFVLEGIRPVTRRGHFDAHSIRKQLHVDRENGLHEVLPDRPLPLALPFNPIHEPIEDVAEMPVSKSVLIFTSASVYSLSDDGTVAEVSGGRSVGSSQLGHAMGMIPVRNEMIVLGRHALFLALDTNFSGPPACNL